MSDYIKGKKFIESSPKKPDIKMPRPLDPNAYYVYAHRTEGGSEDYVYSVFDTEEEANSSAAEYNEFHGSGFDSGHHNEYNVVQGAALNKKFNFI